VDVCVLLYDVLCGVTGDDGVVLADGSIGVRYGTFMGKWSMLMSWK
jgi:hypothetical protein